MACSALVDKLEQPIRLEPFSKFPVIRDLAVDRSVLFENLKAVKAWVPVDGTYDPGAPDREWTNGATRKKPIRCRGAFPVAAAWKPVRSLTKARDLWAPRPFRKCVCSILIPREPRLKRGTTGSVNGGWRASRNAVMRRTVWRFAPRIFH